MLFKCNCDTFWDIALSSFKKMTAVQMAAKKPYQDGQVSWTMDIIHIGINSHPDQYM